MQDVLESALHGRNNHTPPLMVIGLPRHHKDLGRGFFIPENITLA